MVVRQFVLTEHYRSFNIYCRGSLKIHDRNAGICAQVNWEKYQVSLNFKLNEYLYACEAA